MKELWVSSLIKLIILFIISGKMFSLVLFTTLFTFGLTVSFDFQDRFVSKPCDRYPLDTHYLVPINYLEKSDKLERLRYIKFSLPTKAIYYVPHFDPECFSVVIDFPFMKGQCALPIKCGSPRAIVLDAQFFGLKVTHLCYGSGMNMESGVLSKFYSLEFIEPYYHPCTFVLKEMNDMDKKNARDLNIRYDQDSYIVIPNACYHLHTFLHYRGRMEFDAKHLQENVEITYKAYKDEAESCSIKSLIRHFGLLNVKKDLDETSFVMYTYPKFIKQFGDVKYYFNVSALSSCFNPRYSQYLHRYDKEDFLSVFAGKPGEKGRSYYCDGARNKFYDVPMTVPYVTKTIQLPVDNLFVGFLNSLIHKIHETFEHIFELVIKRFLKELKYLIEEFVAPIVEFLFEGIWNVIYDLITDFFTWISKHPLFLKNFERITTSVIIYFIVFLIRGRHIESIFILILFLYISVVYSQVIDCPDFSQLKPSTTDLCVFRCNSTACLIKDILVNLTSDHEGYCISFEQFKLLDLPSDSFVTVCDAYKSFMRACCTQKLSTSTWVDKITTCFYSTKSFEAGCGNKKYKLNRLSFKFCEQMQEPNVTKATAFGDSVRRIFGRNRGLN